MVIMHSRFGNRLVIGKKAIYVTTIGQREYMLENVKILEKYELFLIYILYVDFFSMIILKSCRY